MDRTFHSQEAIKRLMKVAVSVPERRSRRSAAEEGSRFSGSVNGLKLSHHSESADSALSCCPKDQEF